MGSNNSSKTVVKKEPSSFRDPSGFVFYEKGKIYRQINQSYKEDYDYLMSSGLYKSLTKKGLLISHKELFSRSPLTKEGYKIIKPEPVPFISYPYEWCFSQLKDAALATLKIQKISLKFGMSLKDASAYNIQFINGKPVLIDTLSFEKYKEGKPWVAYKQFCQHFLAPLALMTFKDIRLNQLLRIYIDGIPLDLASKLLPFKTWANPSLFTHIHLHAKSQQHFADKREVVKKIKTKMSRRAFLALIESLEKTIRSLNWKGVKTEWGEYYSFTNYSRKAFSQKKKIVNEFLRKARPKTVWDLGANTGEFSRIASKNGAFVVSFDIDPVAVEKNYQWCTKTKEKNILPLLLDLTNPSPDLGWENSERVSLMRRGPADAVLALALIHHLAISNNLPFEKIAQFFHKICNQYLIVEFVPKEDSQVQKLLATRVDIFKEYNQPCFIKTFSRYFRILNSSQITQTKRRLFLMKKLG